MITVDCADARELGTCRVKSVGAHRFRPTVPI
jgi:hypothetical protein